MRAAKTIILLLAIIITNLLTSCNESPASKLLTEADSIIETEPDKALNMLSDIHPGDLSQDEFPYYSLLYTQAQIKCGINVSSDSLIRNAVDYYANDNSRNRKIRAYFYYAYTQYYSKDLRIAMKYTLEAYELAKDKDEKYWIAKSAEFISDIFFESYNYNEAETYTHEAIKNFEITGKITNHRYALCDLAIIYLNQNKNNQAIALLDSLKTVCEKEPKIDIELLDYIEQPLFEAFVKTGQYNEVNDGHYNFFFHTKTNEEKIDAAVLISRIKRHSNTDSIDNSMLNDAMSLISNNEEKARILYALYLNSKLTGDYNQSLALADSLLSLQGAITKEILEESITGVQRDFYSSKAVQQEHKSYFLTITLSIVTAVFAIIIVLIWTIYRFKTHAQRAELEANISSFLTLKANSDKIVAENIKLSNTIKKNSLILEQLTKAMEDKQENEKQHALVIEHLFKEKWVTLNMLCNQYFDMGSSEKTRNAILYNIEQELEKLQSKKSLRQLEDAVNNYLGGIMSLLRNECPFLKENDFTFLSLIFAGFSVRAVCLFTNIKYKLFYLKKSRLTKKISESEAPHKHMFLNKLS